MGPYGVREVIRLLSSLEKSAWGNVGWMLELTDVPWMTVMADMGSDGAIWGHMG